MVLTHLRPLYSYAHMRSATNVQEFVSVCSYAMLTYVLQMSDVGQYKCVADYGGLGEHTSQTATLTVYG